MDTAKILRAAGLTVHDVRIGGRGHIEIRGVMTHHDASHPNTSPSRGAAFIQNGRPPSPQEPKGLPGPLGNAFVDRRGDWWLITDQRANHAGACSIIALNEAMSGRAVERDARDRALLDDTTIGNRYFYGIEVANNGVGEPYPSAQIYSLARGIAALNLAHGLTSRNLLHHREATKRKIDMSWRGPLRDLIDGQQRQLDHPEDDDMAATIGKTLKPDGSVAQWWFIEGPSAVPITPEDAHIWWSLKIPVMDDGAVPVVLRAKAKGVPAA
jgi:hypothetical protein